MSAFQKEIHSLSKGENINQKSSLLSQFRETIRFSIRVLSTSVVVYQMQKFQKTRSIQLRRIREEHFRKLNAGTQATVYGVCETYWTIDGRNVARHVIRQCITCFKAKPRNSNYIMGNLPENRLVPARPFLNVGIDYCGPFYIKEKFFGNRNMGKASVSIFVSRLKLFI